MDDTSKNIDTSDNTQVQFDLEKHLKEEHSSSAIADHLKEIVYGGMDGIVTTFAVVAGFAGAGGEISKTMGTSVVLLFGLANLFGDGLSMGLGNFLSMRSEKEVYSAQRRKEEKEIKNNHKMERLETIEILKKKGYKQTDAEQMVVLYEKNPAFWADFMMDHELELSNPHNENEFKTSVATFLSFVIFGFIPLMPYFLHFELQHYFKVSIASTAIALGLLGLLRWKVTRTVLWKSFFDTYLVGVLAAAAAYSVGVFFR